MSSNNSERLRLQVQEYMALRLPQWRADLASALSDPSVSDEAVWNLYGRSAYLLVRHGYEMAERGEIRTHTYQAHDETPEVVAYRAPMLTCWRQDATKLLGNDAVTGQEAFRQMSAWAYSLTVQVARWYAAQRRGGE